MKNYYFTILFLLIALPAWSQSLDKGFSEGWEQPTFDREIVVRYGIAAINLSQYSRNPSARSLPEKSEAFVYSRSGNLISRTELMGGDTSIVERFQYVKNKALVEREMVDRVWDRTYRTSFRLDRELKTYQEKSVQLLSNNESLILEKRQYLYDEWDRLLSIRCFEGNRLSKILRFEYDQSGRIWSEKTENPQGRTLRETRYTYDVNNRPIAITYLSDGQTETFQYSYNEMGRKERVTWLKDDGISGEAFFSYNEQGLPSRVERKIANEGRRVSTIYTIDYSFFADATPELPGPGD